MVVIALIAKINATSCSVQLVAGKYGTAGSSSNNVKATSTLLSSPNHAWIGTDSNVLFIADFQNRAVAKVDLTTNLKTRWAGLGSNYQASSGDGKAVTDSSVGIMPTAFCGDTAGVVYITDNVWGRVRKVGTNSIISTFLGSITAASFGDGGPASAAAINKPGQCVIDAAGDFFVAEQGANSLRKVKTRMKR